MRRVLLALAIVAGCDDGKDPKPEAGAVSKPEPGVESKPEAGAEPKPETGAELKPEAGVELKPEARPKPGIPDRLKYEQILIAFKGSYVQDGKVVVDTERSKEEAGALGRSLFDRARAGFDFEALKQEFSDDRDRKSLIARGPYESVRDGVRREKGYEIPLSHLYRGLAEVVYKLKVGEVGLVEYDQRLCPQGWLVVKRIE